MKIKGLQIKKELAKNEKIMYEEEPKEGLCKKSFYFLLFVFLLFLNLS